MWEIESEMNGFKIHVDKSRVLTFHSGNESKNFYVVRENYLYQYKFFAIPFGDGIGEIHESLSHSSLQQYAILDQYELTQDAPTSNWKVSGEPKKIYTYQDVYFPIFKKDKHESDVKDYKCIPVPNSNVGYYLVVSEDSEFVKCKNLSKAYAKLADNPSLQQIDVGTERDEERMILCRLVINGKYEYVLYEFKPIVSDERVVGGGEAQLHTAYRVKLVLDQSGKLVPRACKREQLLLKEFDNNIVEITDEERSLTYQYMEDVCVVKGVGASKKSVGTFMRKIPGKSIDKWFIKDTSKPDLNCIQDLTAIEKLQAVVELSRAFNDLHKPFLDTDGKTKVCLHRDIKPENILLDIKGTPLKRIFRAHIIDFGLAKKVEYFAKPEGSDCEVGPSVVTQKTEKVGDILKSGFEGTLSYGAPEIYLKPDGESFYGHYYSTASDVYAFLPIILQIFGCNPLKGRCDLRAAAPKPEETEADQAIQLARNLLQNRYISNEVRSNQEQIIREKQALLEELDNAKKAAIAAMPFDIDLTKIKTIIQTLSPRFSGCAEITIDISRLVMVFCNRMQDKKPLNRPIAEDIFVFFNELLNIYLLIEGRGQLDPNTRNPELTTPPEKISAIINAKLAKLILIAYGFSSGIFGYLPNYNLDWDEELYPGLAEQIIRDFNNSRIDVENLKSTLPRDINKINLLDYQADALKVMKKYNVVTSENIKALQATTDKETAIAVRNIALSDGAKAKLPNVLRSLVGARGLDFFAAAAIIRIVGSRPMNPIYQQEVSYNMSGNDVTEFKQFAFNKNNEIMAIAGKLGDILNYFCSEMADMQNSCRRSIARILIGLFDNCPAIFDDLDYLVRLINRLCCSFQNKTLTPAKEKEIIATIAFLEKHKAFVKKHLSFLPADLLRCADNYFSDRAELVIESDLYIGDVAWKEFYNGFTSKENINSASTIIFNAITILLDAGIINTTQLRYYFDDKRECIGEIIFAEYKAPHHPAFYLAINALHKNKLLNKKNFELLCKNRNERDMIILANAINILDQKQILNSNTLLRLTGINGVAIARALINFRDLVLFETTGDQLNTIIFDLYLSIVINYLNNDNRELCTKENLIKLIDPQNKYIKFAFMLLKQKDLLKTEIGKLVLKSFFNENNSDTAKLIIRLNSYSILNEQILIKVFLSTKMQEALTSDPRLVYLSTFESKEEIKAELKSFFDSPLELVKFFRVLVKTNANSNSSYQNVYEALKEVIAAALVVNASLTQTTQTNSSSEQNPVTNFLLALTRAHNEFLQSCKLPGNLPPAQRCLVEAANECMAEEFKVQDQRVGFHSRWIC